MGCVDDPPTSFAIWTSCIPATGTSPSFPTVATELSLPASSGDTVITIKDTSGLIQNLRILFGEPGSGRTEVSKIDGTTDVTMKQVTVDALAKFHPAGEPVFGGPCNHRNDFGGTSAAAPLSAGICALVLSANPELTWLEARDILRETAEKIDFGNSDPRGQWFDRDGKQATTRESAFFSEFYGHGRLDAFNAVQAAHEYKVRKDLMIRKNLNDQGSDPEVPFDDSPDIWVRDSNPANDPDALAAAYDVPGPHQDPSAGSDHWIYARVKNRGIEASLDAWVRFYVALSDGSPLAYPDAWQPKNGIGNRTAESWDSGVDFVGEVGITNLGPGTDCTVQVHWPKELIPPVFHSGEAGAPSILVEVLPLDGPNNNLASKKISIRANSAS
jgi:hypothetical protein